MNDLSYSLDLTFALVTTYVMHSTIFLLGCWICMRVFRPSSHSLAERAWKSCAVAGVLTTAVQMGVGSSAFLKVQMANPKTHANDRERVANLASAMPVVDSSGPSSRWRVHASIQEAVTIGTDLPKAGAEAVVEPAPAETRVENVAQAMPDAGAAAFSAMAIKRMFALIAIGWFMIGLIRIMGCVFVMRFRVRRFPVLQSGRTRRLLDGLLERNKGARMICLRMGPPTQEPIALGCLQWTVFVPEGFDRSLSDDEITAVLAHELAHLVRRDVVWLWVGKALCACLGFQPLNLVARRRWQHAAEFLCDQWAVEHGTRSLDLAKCLTKLAAWRVNAGPELSMPATGAKATLARRVQCLVGREEICDTWQTTRRKWLLAIFVTTVACVMIIAGPGVRAASQSTGNSSTTEAIRNASPEDKPTVGALTDPISAVLKRVDDDISLQDFQSFVRLDLELTALNNELDQGMQILSGQSQSKAIAEQIEKIREGIASIESKRNGLKNHFSTEQ